jgi:23S rRNA pseudouridine955/2504/2580 synthase
MPHPPAARPPAPEDETMLQRAILHRDEALIALDKPPGLAVQGGSETERHVDALLDALRFGYAERPRLVHRLDKDTTGILVIARTAAAAAFLARAFRDKRTRKIYWAIVVGVPQLPQGRIDLALAKISGRGGERVRPSAGQPPGQARWLKAHRGLKVHPRGAAARGPREADAEEGRHAVTYYRVVDSAGARASWLALLPVTGRTHQLRAHCAAIGTPILGDGKYGGAASHLAGVPGSRRLHLHARALSIPHPAGGTLTVTAPLPPHMRQSWEFFGFAPDIEDPFAELDLSA